MNRIKTPIGMEPLVDTVRQMCNCARQYRNFGIPLGHFALLLDEGNGRTTAASYISDAFYEAGVRNFGGLDRLLEYRLDGSMAQLKQTLRHIRASAVYTNAYEGVIAWDASVLAAHPGEDQTRLFLEELPRIAAHATMIFFLPSAPSRSQLALLEKIRAQLGPGQLHQIQIPSYSEQALADMTRAELTERMGIWLEDGPDTEETLQALVRQSGTRSACQAVQLAQQLARNADFGGFTPVLKREQLKLQEMHPKEVR